MALTAISPLRLVPEYLNNDAYDLAPRSYMLHDCILGTEVAENGR